MQPSQRIGAEILLYKVGFHTAERAILVISLMSSFPVQTRGIESESWLKIVANLDRTLFNQRAVQTREVMDNEVMTE